MTHLFEVKSCRHAEALRERDRFLLTHPKLKAFQETIDRELKKAHSSHNRLVVIHTMMMESFLEMHKKLQELVKKRCSNRTTPAD